MVLQLSKEVYPKYALLKSAYNFTDKAYIHLDADEKYYIVELKAKADSADFDEGNFENEMLTQAARYAVAQRTKNIRELVTARAMASTLIGETGAESTECEEDIDMDCVLKDWFENENS